MEYYNKYNDHLGKIIFKTLIEQNGSSKAVFVDGDSKKSLSVEEIRKESIQFAIALKNMGMKKNDVMAIICEKHLRYCIPIIASWYLGVAIYPLNPDYTKRELLHLLKSSKPKMIYCSQNTLENVLSLRSEINSIQHFVCYDGSHTEVSNYWDLLNTKEDTLKFKPDDFDKKHTVAAIFCSSGTTGFPKGVMLTHENLRFCLKFWSDPNFGDVSSKDSTVSVLPYFHLYGIYIMLMSLVHGLLSVEMKKFKPEIYLQNIEDFKVTKMYMVPTLAVFLAKSSLVEKYDISSVKDIVCGAAILSEEIDTILRKRFNISCVRQIYGLTEVSGAISMTPSNVTQKRKCCGQLLPMVVCKTVDIETRKVLGPNQIGEICLKTPMTMKGYINDSISTAATIDEEGYLITGDIGYYDEDNCIYIVDRIKDIIKYKGYQVPPSELENILLSHDAVKDVGVVGKPDERCGEYPVAFVVLQPDRLVDSKELIKFVEGQVSIQKRIQDIIFIKELPKTGSGKMLRRKLRELLL